MLGQRSWEERDKLRASRDKNEESERELDRKGARRRKKSDEDGRTAPPPGPVDVSGFPMELLPRVHEKK